MPIYKIDISGTDNPQFKYNNETYTMRILFLIVIFFLPNYIFSETVKLIDGRTLKLNADGTYKFVKSA